LNRGEKPYPWTVPLADGESASQVFTASGEVDNFTIEHKDGLLIVTVPAVDGVVLRVHSEKK
jgi:hypothetical protein